MQIGNAQVFDAQLSSGKGANLTGPLDVQTAQLLSTQNITELQIGAEAGEGDLTFIDLLKELEMLFIEVPVTKGIKKVEQLSALRGLYFSGISPEETASDDLDFPNYRTSLSECLA